MKNLCIEQKTHLLKKIIENAPYIYSILCLALTLALTPAIVHASENNNTEVQSPELDPDAVWENIGNLQKDIAEINDTNMYQTEQIEEIQTQYSTLEELLETYQTENETLAEKLEFTNQLIIYLITKQGEYHESDIQNITDIGYSIETGNASLKDALITVNKSISDNSVITGEIYKLQHSDISNKEVSENISTILASVSDNTLEANRKTESANQLGGIVAASLIIIVASIALFFIGKMFIRAIINHLER